MLPIEKTMIDEMYATHLKNDPVFNSLERQNRMHYLINIYKNNLPKNIGSELLRKQRTSDRITFQYTINRVKMDDGILKLSSPIEKMAYVLNSCKHQLSDKFIKSIQRKINQKRKLNQKSIC